MPSARPHAQSGPDCVRHGIVSEFTYRPELCLVQIATADEAWCIDTLAPLDLTEMWAVLTDPQHMVIAHAARQELLFALDATGKRLADCAMCNWLRE